MKILVIGCSYSAGIEKIWEPEVPCHWSNTWSYILQQKIDCEIINLAISGSDIYVSNMLLREGVEKYNPDLVLFQITTAGRHSLTSFTFGKLTNYWPTKKVAENYYIIDTKRDDLVHNEEYIYSIGVSDYIPPVTFGTNTEWHEAAIKGKRVIKEPNGGDVWYPDGSYDDIMLSELMKKIIGNDKTEHIKLYQSVTENVRNTFQTIGSYKSRAAELQTVCKRITYASVVESAKYYCERRQIPNVFFDWLPSYKTIKSDAVHTNDPILHVDSNIIDFNVYTSIPEAELYALDRSLHYSREGNQLVAELVYNKLQEKNMLTLGRTM